jgi:proteic killer suppression protein
MIKSFAHKGLEKFYRTGSKSGIQAKYSGIQAKHAQRLRLILSNLDQAEGPNDMDMPGLKLHELKGERKGIWAVRISGNWRATFRFKGRDAEIVNYEDYH